MSDGLRSRKLSLKQKEYVALVLIMLLAIFLRFYLLQAIPVGLSGDEGADGFGAKRILRGESLPIFFTADFGEEPMHTYLVALSFASWGVSLWAIRFVSALVGILTIPVIFWLAKELFPADEGSSSLVPILSAFWLATSYWHIIYSRAGLEVVTLPLFSSAIFYFLWRGIRSARRWPFIVGGLLLGASLYSYRGARFLPILLAIFFGGWLLSSREFRRRHFVNLTLLVVVAALLFAPLAMYGLAHPDVFFAREMHVSIFNPDWERGSPLQAFAVALVKTIGMFNFQGDPEFDRNPGRRPVLDPISSLCFIIGLAIALRRWKRPSYLFTIVWFLTMALPGAFTAEALPHFHRGIGALPALCLLSAIGLVSAKDWLGRMSWRGAREVSWAIVCLVLIPTTMLSYRDYFAPWQQRLANDEVIGKTYMEAAAVMNATRIPDGVWILPATSLRPRNLPFYEVDFLYDGPEPQYTLNVDEETAPAELSEICQGRRQAAVVTWKYFTLEEAYLSLNSDPKGLLDFLFRKYGRRTGQEPFESFDLVVYELPASPDFAIARAFDPLDINFGAELRLLGIALGGSSLNPTSTPEELESNVLPSGKEGWVVLQWQAVETPSKDYKVAVYLLDGEGRLVGQADKLLLSNYLQPTSGWSANQVEMDYYTLPNLPATPPGEYDIQVVVYDPETMERLTVFDQQEGVTKTSLVVGTLQVIKPLEPPQVEPLEQLSDAESDIAPSIRLLGYDLQLKAVGPGETVSVALYWQALEDVRQDYLLSVGLKNTEGQVWLEQEGRPVDDTYATTEWDEGEVLRDWHDLALPGDIPQGLYEIFVGVLEGQDSLGEVPLGQIEVRGRARRFTIPEIQHPTEARFGDVIQFLGYDLSSDELTAGGTLELTLYWQTLQEMETSYTVFTHLLDAEEHIWGQMDSIPGRETAPTTSWVESEIVTDEYEILVDPAAPAGEYVIEIGMYDASTGERLPVYDMRGQLPGDRLLLEGIRVTSE
jgi:4-amino-4-deoxy-L-arabinose transferase-like glycosyltransferase